MSVRALAALLFVLIADDALANDRFFDPTSGRPVAISKQQFAAVRAAVVDTYSSQNKDSVEIPRADAARDANGKLLVCTVSSVKKTSGTYGPLNFITVTLSPTGERLGTYGARVNFEICRKAHVNLHFEVR
jgi:hypothetical protein